MKYFCLSFDLEEFDIPSEWGKSISKNEMFKISLEGTKRVIDLVEKHNVKSTFFVTTDFCKKYPNLIKKLSKYHEISCHGEHSKNYQRLEEGEVLKSIRHNKVLLEKCTGKKVVGFRAPRMLTPVYTVLEKLGLRYDASLHPTYVPGRYNHFLSPRKVFKKEGIVVVPTSTVLVIRAPFTWLWFRNLGIAYSKTCTNLCFLKDFYVSIYFHPWEFVSLERFEIPAVIKRNTGEKVSCQLSRYLEWLAKKGVKFITLDELCNNFSDKA